MAKKIEIAIDEKSGPAPLCPHCSGELRHLNQHKGKVQTLLNLHVFSCPHCRKVLEIRTIGA